MNNINDSMKELARLAQESDKRQLSFLQHVLLVLSSTFGILISLHTTTPEFLYARWVFVLAVAILGSAILCNAIALYNQTKLVDRGRKAYADECIIAFRENRKPESIAVNKTGIHAFCELATYILSIVALLLLCIYGIMNTLFS